MKKQRKNKTIMEYEIEKKNESLIEIKVKYSKDYYLPQDERTATIEKIKLEMLGKYQSYHFVDYIVCYMENDFHDKTQTLLITFAANNI